MSMDNSWIKAIRALGGDIYVRQARVSGIEEDGDFTNECSFNDPRLKSLKMDVVFQESGATGMVDPGAEEELLSKLIDIFYQEFQ